MTTNLATPAAGQTTTRSVARAVGQLLPGAVGFIAAGMAVARAGRWTGWRRYPVLAVGVWTLSMLPLQFTPLLPLSVAVYAVTIAAFAIALLAGPEGSRTMSEPPLVLAGLTWAAALRGWMVQMAADGSAFHWYGTFALVLARDSASAR